MDILKIKMPRVGTNDDTVTIGSWYVDSGAYVNAGDAIASLETTKETEDLIAEQAGFVFYEYSAGTELTVGEEIAVISESKDYKVEKKEKVSAENITEKAQILIEKYKVDIEKLKGKKIIREKDVLELIGKKASSQNMYIENSVILVSGGYVSKMCIDILTMSKSFNILGILDPNIPVGTEILGVKVLGGDEMLKELRQQGYIYAINCNGSKSNNNEKESFYLREKIYDKIKTEGFMLPNIIHPSAIISPFARLGEGNIVLENASIGPDASIGNDCLINTGAIVSHDCLVGDHTRLSPGSVIAGAVTIGKNCLIGMGTTVYMDLTIGDNVVVSNGKDIFSNLKDNSFIV